MSCQRSGHHSCLSRRRQWFKSPLGHIFQNTFFSFSFFQGHQTFLFKISRNFPKSPRLQSLRGENYKSYKEAFKKAYLLCRGPQFLSLLIPTFLSQMATILDLPLEILVEILSYLRLNLQGLMELSSVCHRFRSAVFCCPIPVRQSPFQIRFSDYTFKVKDIFFISVSLRYISFKGVVMEWLSGLRHHFLTHDIDERWFKPKLCNQVGSLDHFVVQNSGDFLC